MTNERERDPLVWAFLVSLLFVEGMMIVWALGGLRASGSATAPLMNGAEQVVSAVPVSVADAGEAQ